MGLWRRGENRSVRLRSCQERAYAKFAAYERKGAHHGANATDGNYNPVAYFNLDVPGFEPAGIVPLRWRGAHRAGWSFYFNDHLPGYAGTPPQEENLAYSVIASPQGVAIQ